MSNACVITIVIIGCLTFLFAVDRICECIEKRNKNKEV